MTETRSKTLAKNAMACDGDGTELRFDAIERALGVSE